MWPFGKRKPRKSNAARFVRARFDAAVTNVDNIRHWAGADGLSADAAASPAVRRTLRNRSRYEAANNSYARGIVLTLANDCVGTGARLQLLTGDSETNRIVERAFADWAMEVRLAEKLRTMRMAKSVDGEAFAVLTANGKLASPVKLDIRLVEADRVKSPDLGLTHRCAVDGIEFDRHGNPARYKGYLFDLTGKTNNDTFDSFAAGECLFEGASGSKRGDGAWEITYSFASSPNRTDLTIGAITDIDKKGWEYLWVLYSDVEDGGMLAKQPRAVYVEKVYEEGDFDKLDPDYSP